MHLFWQYGFEGVSLDLLRREMGSISSASFYAAFGSKEALYRETVAAYLGSHGRVMQALGDQDVPPRDRIEQALRGSAEMQTADAHPTGCLITLSATVGPQASSPIQAITADERRRNRQAIADCVKAGVMGGDLGTDTDVEGLAALFEGLLVGLSIQARDGVDRHAIDAAITQALAAWDANAGGVGIQSAERGASGADRSR
ncbi:TetR/AcrR family transcriptional regulator [Sphingomonas sp. RIT328]|uniref:TetR/AcrR family transcriptional regulator n=1 Tax=Sphingomonas sp. RIT328 TaxID=1470591 RepID=UPI00044C8C6E|nr:TetR/AcrR family transcriptional regulator [Sphingomonas sp. RIT328]EZP49976.1 Transcriptional regulator TetR [Sphingomonas sp. RIT328]